jgi:hypothetical protein
VNNLQPRLPKCDFLTILKQDLRLHRQSFHVQSMDSYRDSKSGLQFREGPDMVRMAVGYQYMCDPSMRRCPHYRGPLCGGVNQ